MYFMSLFILFFMPISRMDWILTCFSYCIAKVLEAKSIDCTRYQLQHFIFLSIPIPYHDGLQPLVLHPNMFL